eukprot:1218010-Pyramimonas_sp.AAC.1
MGASWLAPPTEGSTLPPPPAPAPAGTAAGGCSTWAYSATKSATALVTSAKTDSTDAPLQATAWISLSCSNKGP